MFVAGHHGFHSRVRIVALGCCSLFLKRVQWSEPDAPQVLKPFFLYLLTYLIADAEALSRPHQQLGPLLGKQKGGLSPLDKKHLGTQRSVHRPKI